MSTNLNTNNSSQTLFRFAAMRNPELSDPKNLERRFIFRNTAIGNTSIFNTNLQAEKTLQAICRKINQPSSNITLNIFSESGLKDIHSGKFYELAVWVARNKATATKEEFDKKISYYKTNNPTLIHLPDPTRIWDNLVYQVVTQKDFYAKELIMQYLYLEHILNVYDNSEDSYQDMKKAKVVLPKELFKVSQTDFNSTDSSTVQRTMYDDKAIKFAEATINLKENESLMDSLSKLEKTYKKQHDAAYKEAYNKYQETVKPLLKTAQKDSAEADRKKQILENRINYLTQLSVADPEKFYANSELDMELHRIKDEIMQITTPETEIPEFDFKFETPEIDITAMGRTLEVKDQSALLRVMGASSLTEALSDISSFDELTQNITQSNQSLQQTVLNNTVLNQQVSTNVGGVIVPVSNNTSTSGYIPFSIKTYARSSTEWSLLLALSSNLEVVSANYKIVLNGVDFSSTSVSPMGGGSCLLFNLPRILVSQTSGMGGFILQGQVKLSDGNTYNLNVTLLQDTNDLDRMTKQYHFRGDAGCVPVDPPKPENPETPETPETPTYNPTDSSSFIPSGFGMKNIGVADYLKVEQSTYCYVEGDVAHIENIMAREYKERSTRRLKRSESQTTKSSESEKEKLTDTTSTERHEMQSEISKILQESKDFAAQAGAYANWGMGDNKFGITANASYATHNSKEESNRQAVTEAKDITARALDRIVTKVKEERIDKVLEEYEENNKHGFDNTKGSSHVVGVYRWVDKVVKNQIYNYGKRMMFEFMIPEPAKLHNLGVKMIDASEKLLKPVDPRESSTHKLDNFSSLNDDTKLKFWLSKYNVEIDEFPVPTFNINKSFHERDSSHAGHDDGKVQVANGSGEVEIPEGYIVNQVTYTFNTYPHGFNGSHQAFITIAGRPIPWIESIHQTQKDGTIGNLNVRNKLAYSFATGESPIIEGSLDILCNLTLEAKNAWLQSTFNKIIEAYNAEMDRYNQALSEAKALGVQIKGSNPGFYRKIENTVLRKNCISYMIDQNTNASLTFGKNKYYNNGYTSGDETFLNTDIKVDSSLDQYAAFVKFMEQAFEWDIMSYYFYPYYWGDRKRWSDMYQFDDNDPTFRAFMQSGMARVIVTVRPGFEEAVRHFFATGQIWNGGEVPVIDDALFLSIVDEMRSALGKKQGEPWREKIPTSLTILQADSIGLKVEKALPCNCEPGVKFDDQLGEMCGSNFELNNNQIGQSGDKWIEISFNEMDDTSFTTIQHFKDAGVYPKTFECLGNTFEINDIPESEPSLKLYKRIAEEVSQIEGVEAYPTGENGITFKINARLIKDFSFIEASANSEDKKFLFSTDADTYVKVTSPHLDFGLSRVLDKNGQTLSYDEYKNQAPLSKFLV